MSKKLFVGSLPFNYTDDQLRELFAAVGPVANAKMVWDKKHNRSRGFGFVTMGSDADHEAAIARLNGSLVAEKKIWVTEARAKQADAPDPDAAPSPFPRRPFQRGPDRSQGYRDGPPGGGRGRFAPRGGRPFSNDSRPPFDPRGPRRGPGRPFGDAPGRGRFGGGPPRDRSGPPSRGRPFSPSGGGQPFFSPGPAGAPGQARRPFGRKGFGSYNPSRPEGRPSFPSRGGRPDAGRGPARRPFKKGLQRGPRGPKPGV